MKRRAVLALVVAVTGVALGAAAEPSPPPAAPTAPSNATTEATAWLGPVGIARVLVEARRDRVRVTTELTLPGAAARAQPLTLFASYGAPGPPLALGAELVATPRGYLRAPSTARGTRLRARFSPTAPDAATLIVGTRHMAGSVIDISRSELARALAPSGSATLRIETVRAMPLAAPDGSHELLVRLGTQRGRPLVLGSVEVRGAHVARKSARLCDRNGGDVPLAVVPVTTRNASLVPPPLAARKPRDALCVKLWLDSAT